MPSNVNRNPRAKALGNALDRVSRQFPRIQIMVILGLTGAAGFFTSFALLRLGLTQMVLRYPIAIAAGYGVFIMLIGFWLWLQRSDTDVLDASDFGGLDLPIGDGGVSAPTSVGDFGGGGAGVDWDGPGVIGEKIGGGGNGGGGWDFDLPSIDLDDAIWLVLALVVLLAGLIVIFYVIWIAPALLAEVLVDGLLAAGLYKTVKGAQGSHWMKTVLRKTAIPAILVLVFFTLGGFFVQKIEPTATSIGEVWRSMSK